VIPRFQAYLFDVDGTLLASAADICGAVRTALGEVGVDGLDEAYLRGFVGFHLFDLFRQVLPHYTPEQNDALLQRYRQIYLGRGHRSTRVYDGIPEMLGALGGRKSTATTKSSETTRAFLTQFGLVSYFDHVQGTDGFPSKPEPEIIHRALAALGARPEDCLMVGDAAPDMEAGRRAGVRTCAVSWGYGNHEAMRALKPDFWIEDPAELIS
jgi:HAD superfamily hydrolase (TIGR01509 family)